MEENGSDLIRKGAMNSCLELLPYILHVRNQTVVFFIIIIILEN